jgi:hypothetical protein
VTVKRIFLAAALTVCWRSAVSAASLDLLTPYLSGQYFTWQEHSDGRTIVKESGPLFSAGVLAGAVTDFRMTLRGKGELFLGEVGYDGETQGGDPVPVHTDVFYFGATHQLDLGYRASTGRLNVEPFAGAGYRWWLRNLQDTRSATGVPVSGYSELWQTAYTRVGVRGRYLTSSGTSLYLEGGGKYPFFTGNSVDFTGFGTTTFRPAGRWSGFADAAIEWERLRLTLIYEGFRFSQSPIKRIGTRLFYQPDSSSDTIGLSVGWSFR